MKRRARPNCLSFARATAIGATLLVATSVLLQLCSSAVVAYATTARGVLVELSISAPSDTSALPPNEAYYQDPLLLTATVYGSCNDALPDGAPPCLSTFGSPDTSPAPLLGTVDFYDNGLPIDGCTSVPVVGGFVTNFTQGGEVAATPAIATCLASTPGTVSTPQELWAIGSHDVVAKFNALTNPCDLLVVCVFSPASSSTVTEFVARDPSRTYLDFGRSGTSWQGQQVSFTAAVLGADQYLAAEGGQDTVTSHPSLPTGPVVFYSNGYPISGCESVPLNSLQQATCTTSSLAKGYDVITAFYPGDPFFQASSRSVNWDVQ